MSKEENLNHLSSKELKEIMDKELKSSNPDYNKISLISTILSSRENPNQSHTSSPNSTNKEIVFQNTNTQPVPVVKKSLGSRLLGPLSSGKFKLFFLVCLLGAFYVGSWFFRLSYVDDWYDENLFGRITFGVFSFATAITYFIYYLLRTNYKSSENYISSNSLKILLLLGFTTILDINFLLLDISPWAHSYNWHLFVLLANLSFMLKIYAYSRFFSVKNDKNLFINRFLGVSSKLVDYQFVVYVIAGILLMVMSISAFLVKLYDIDSSRFLFGFLLPFALTFVASILSASFFNMNFKIWERITIIMKVLFPLITMIGSILIVPIAVVFFLIHAFFLFRKIFELELFNNPTFVLSQIYIGVTITTLIAYFVIKVLKPIALNHIINKIIKFTLTFHLFYALIGIIFAFAGMLIRINSVGFTDNRILALIGLSIQFVFLVFAIFSFVRINGFRISITEDLTAYNRIFKFLYIIPIIFLIFNWLIVGVVRYDQKRVKSILENSTNLDDFRTGYYWGLASENQVVNGNYIIRTIEQDSSNTLAQDKEYEEFQVKVLNKYLKGSSNIAQMFIVINLGEYPQIEKYELNSDMSDFFKNNKYGGSETTCRKEFYELISLEDVSQADLRDVVNTWDVYSFSTNTVSNDGYNYLESAFWQTCFDYNLSRY